MLKKTVEDAILARIPELLEPLLEEIDLTALMGNAVENILNAAFSGAPVPQLQQQRHTETTSSTSRDMMLPIHDFCRMLTKRGSAHTDFSNDVTAKPAIADNGGGGGGAPTAKSIDATAGAESTSKDKGDAEEMEVAASGGPPATHVLPAPAGAQPALKSDADPASEAPPVKMVKGGGRRKKRFGHSREVLSAQPDRGGEDLNASLSRMIADTLASDDFSRRMSDVQERLTAQLTAQLTTYTA